MAENKPGRFHFPINLGTIVFLVIVIYLSAYTVRYLGKSKLAIYEVSESDITDSIKSTGIILRKETLISTTTEGYINYYVKDGSRVANKETVYTVDTTGKIQAYLNELLTQKDYVSNEEKKQIFDDLKTYSEGYNDNSFSAIYEAKSDINHDLMSYTDTILADNKDKLEANYGKNCYLEIPAESSGLVSFSSDGLENISVKDVSSKIFQKKNKLTDLRNKEKEKAGSAVYRITTSQKWKLMIPINEDEYNRVKNLKKNGSSTVQVTFNKDNFVTTAPFILKKQNKEYYVILEFDNFVQRYLSQRFLSVEILLSETEGLKIPSSSLVKKEVYKIPKEYLTTGSNSDVANQVNLSITDKKGISKLKQLKVQTYLEQGENVYIATTGLKNGDILSDADQQKKYTLKDTSTIPGVFIVNRGYAVFEPVSMVERNEDYCIISAENSSIELYDRIILNSDTIKENQVIY